MVQLEDGGWGEIKYFFADEVHSAIAVIEPLDLVTQQPSFVCNSRLADFIKVVKRSNETIARPVKHIIRKCVLVHIQDADMLYLCRIPNFCESD